MYKRPRHQAIAKAISMMDASLLGDTACFFGGGTAIALMLDEYRESVDIDFLCASQDGFRALRNILPADPGHGLGDVFTQPVKYLRPVRTDQYKISTFIEVDGTPIKLEFVREGRVALAGSLIPSLPVPVLGHADLFTQKLLANADRGLDKAEMSRDAIDLAMMIHGWGDIPADAYQKAYGAYGAVINRAFDGAVGLLSDSPYLAECLQKMAMDPALDGVILPTLERAAIALARFQPGLEAEYQKRVNALPKLSSFGGVAYTFAAAAARVKGPIDWAALEHQVMADSIKEHGQEPHIVAAWICQHSPGTLSAEKEALIWKCVEHIKPDDEAPSNELDAPQLKPRW